LRRGRRGSIGGREFGVELKGFSFIFYLLLGVAVGILGA
jgi:hypothetical protein